MTTLSDTPPKSEDDSRLRVVLMLDIKRGEQQRFLQVYEALRHSVASVPGHISDQLCQSIEDPSQWLITSEWESARPFLQWVESEAHREMVRPMHGCVRDTRSLRFSILRETSAAGATGDRVPIPERTGDGVVRHALTFTVKPGSEQSVAAILAGYTSPRAQVDATTRLCRTSLFMHGNRVVRAVEVTGNLVAALRHVAQQPEVREVEEAINPYLEEDRDLDDPESARAFFTRAALPPVHDVAADALDDHEVRRHALLYPVRRGSGPDVTRLLGRADEAAAADPAKPLVRSTIFLRDDVVVRMIDMRAPLDEDPSLAAGIGDADAAAELSRMVDTGPGGDLMGTEGIRRFLAAQEMNLVTDRRAQGY